MLVLAFFSATLVQAAGTQCVPTETHYLTLVSTTLEAERISETPFGGALHLRFEPIQYGWRITVREAGRSEDLSRLTPPWHFVPNPRYLEGWHFRNADNTGPNDGSINAPQAVRQFIFSPEVGRTLDYAGSGTTRGTVEAVARFGRGTVWIGDYTLSPPLIGQKASFVSATVEACVWWPREYAP